MNRKALRSLASIVLIASFVMGVCACNRNAESVSTDSYWYGCSSFRVPAVEGYRQGMRSSIYSDGYYYLAVYGEKSDEKTDGPEEYYRLYKIDSDGNEVSNVSLPVKCAHSGNQAVIENDRLHCSDQSSNTDYVIDINRGKIINEEITDEITMGFYSVDDGYVKMSAGSLTRYSKEGNESGRIKGNEIANAISFYQKDGTYYLIANKNGKIISYEADFDKSRLEKILESSSADLESFEINNGIFFSDKGVYYIDTKSKMLMPVTEWNYVDIKPAYKAVRYELNLAYDNLRFGRLYAYEDSEIELIIFNNLPAENNANKKVITIGGYGVDFSVAIKWAVYRFNTSQNEYRVFLDDYWNEYSYESGIEAQSQIAKLIKHFSEGGAPDIFYGANFDYRYMYNAGLVTDMMPFMEKDPDFSTDDLLPSIKDTLVKNGACYQIFPAFYFDGDFGRKADFGDENITYKMVDDLAQKKNIPVRGDMEAAEYADQIIRYSLGDLVDNSTGAHIVSEEQLKEIVEYSVKYGISFGGIENSIADMDTVHKGMHLTCRRTYLGNLYDLADIESSLNDSFVYLGFPSINGSARAAQTDGLVAISSDSNYKEACWQLIKYMLTDEVQEIEIIYGNNPVINTVFEDHCKYAAHPDSVSDNEVVWKSIVRGKKAVPDRIISDYREMVLSINSVISYDWGLYNIICDEVNAYYYQNKSPEAIAKTFQSRLDLYVSENYK